MTPATTKHEITDKEEWSRRRRRVVGKTLFLVILCHQIILSVMRLLDFTLPLMGTNDLTTTTIPTTSTSSGQNIDTDVSSIGSRIDSSSINGRQFITTFSTENNEFHDLRAPIVTKTIPLEELVNSGPDPECQPVNSYNMILYPSTQRPRINPQRQQQNEQKIPKIIHMTAASRCMTESIRNNIKRWETLPGYTIYFHDDIAVDRLLTKYWPNFPHLSMARQCSISGAAKADIWRYLVLWEYGGFYTDIDNAPGKGFNNGKIISDDDQAWFVVERIGVLSQYFMGGIPHHPFFFIAMMTCLSRLITFVEEIGTQYVPYITGPGVTKAAMMIYMKNTVDYQTVKEGNYTGIDGTTLTVRGKKNRSQFYIKRESIPKKIIEFNVMKMKHFTQSKNNSLRDSCYEYLYKMAIQKKKDKQEEEEEEERE